MTPTSTYRINRRGGGEGGDSRGIRTSSLIQSSMQSTPEANKRDKIVSRTMTVPVTITNNKNGFHQQQRIMEEQQQIEKDQILPHPLPHQQPTTSSSSPPPLPPPHHPSQTPILPFLDPWRKQEVQTREQFIG
ncbi:unnamed protein product [Meloidogyne enterolobii]